MGVISYYILVVIIGGGILGGIGIIYVTDYISHIHILLRWVTAVGFLGGCMFGFYGIIFAAKYTANILSQEASQGMLIIIRNMILFIVSAYILYKVLDSILVLSHVYDRMFFYSLGGFLFIKFILLYSYYK